MEPQDPNDRSRPCTAVQLPVGGAVTFALDNETVYVTGESGLAILRRDPVTGAVSPAPGPKPCFAHRPIHRYGCRDAPGLIGEVTHLAQSPDGRFVFVASEQHHDLLDEHTDQSITVFQHVSGSLEPVPGRSGCASTRKLPGCRGLHGVAGTIRELVFSPDGTTAYADAIESLLTLRVDPRTGALAQLAGRHGCADDSLFDRIRECRRLDAARRPTLSPDGRFAYIANFWDDRIDVLARNSRTGELTPLHGRAGCIALRARRCMHGVGLGHVFSLALTPDGRTLIGLGFAISVFNRVP
jgi:DNA-binding beta-propeller fold protein YncE